MASFEGRGSVEGAPEEIFELLRNISTAALHELVGQQADLICRALSGDGGTPDHELRRRVELEVAALFLHLLDRLAFGLLGPERRKALMDPLAEEVAASFADAYCASEPISDDADAVVEFLNSRQTEYAQYRDLLPGKDEVYEGTLFWEFAKRLVLTYRSHPNPVTIHLICISSSGMYVAFLRGLQAAGLISEENER